MTAPLLPAIDDAWGLDPPEPTSLIVPWPERDAPAPEAIAAAVAGALGTALATPVGVHPGPPEDGVAWSAGFGVEGREAAIITWAEPARALAGDEPPAVAAGAASWVVGFETLLDPSRAIDDFAALVRGLAAAFPDAPAILDVNTTRWYARDDLERLFAGPIETPAEVMWLTQVVRSAAGASWIHTHGLWRCGRPELEMLEVPDAAAAHAAELLGGVAALMLEGGAPAPGQPVEVGSDLLVVLQPWAEVARYLADDVPGSGANRAGDAEAAHAGPRAVVCAPEPAGAFRKLWVWPEDAVERLRRNEAAMSLTDRATRRQARLAQAAWNDLVRVFAAAGDAEFAVKAGLVTDDDRREHLWFDVETADADGLDGRLLNEPRFRSDLAPGARLRLRRDQVSDWRVMTREGSFGPLDAAALLRGLEGASPT